MASIFIDYKSYPFPDEPVIPCNVYNDGGHYIATQCYNYHTKRAKKMPRIKRKVDDVFEELRDEARKEGLRDRKNNKAFSSYIKSGIEERMPDFPVADSYVEEKVKSYYHNLHARKKRFRRKAYFNEWNYFVTLTYDDEKQTPESFVKRVKRAIGNFHTRRGYKCMGVFEKSPETGRVHFHALMYIPNGEMIGEIVERTDYNTTTHTMQTIHCNTFFEKRFGRNDFEELPAGITNDMINYILKYIDKTDENVYYTRGICSGKHLKIAVNDIASTFLDFVTKYVLFDDVLERYERRVEYEEQAFDEVMIC